MFSMLSLHTAGEIGWCAGAHRGGRRDRERREHGRQPRRQPAPTPVEARARAL